MGLAVTVRPVTGVGEVTLFAPENVLCVAAPLLPHERLPDVSLIKAWPDVVGIDDGKVKV